MLLTVRTGFTKQVRQVFQRFIEQEPSGGGLGSLVGQTTWKGKQERLTHEVENMTITTRGLTFYTVYGYNSGVKDKEKKRKKKKHLPKMWNYWFTCQTDQLICEILIA